MRAPGVERRIKIDEANTRVWECGRYLEVVAVYDEVLPLRCPWHELRLTAASLGS